jgi:hypothetical protein
MKPPWQKRKLRSGRRKTNVPRRYRIKRAVGAEGFDDDDGNRSRARMPYSSDPPVFEAPWSLCRRFDVCAPPASKRT